MKIFIKIRTTFLPLLLLTSVLFVSFFGIFFCTKMIMNIENVAGMTMTSHCTSTDGTSNCHMDIATHLNGWNHVLEAILNSSLLGLLFVVLLICVRTLATTAAPFSSEKFQFYLKNHQRYKLYNYFVELFSQGILQPKLLA